MNAMKSVVVGLLYMVGAAIAGELPETYKLARYLESNGTQYLDTGVTAKPSTRLVMKFAYTVTDAGGGIGYGASGSAQSFRFWRSIEKDTGYAIYNVNIDDQFGDVDSYNSGAAPDTEAHVIDISNAAKSIDGHAFENTKGNLTKNNAGSLYLFGQHWGWNPQYGEAMKARIYSCQIYDDKGLVRDFVPCVRVSDNVAGLYDTLENGKFYTILTKPAGDPLVVGKLSGLAVSHTHANVFTADGFAPGLGESATTGSVTCTAPSGEQMAGDGTVKYTVTGWKLTETSGDGATETTTGDGTSCKIDVDADTYFELEWQLSPQYKVTATAGDGGTVSPAEQWVNAGETCAPITATPDDGYAFYKWTGDVPAGSAGVNPLGLSVGAPLAVVANFGNGIYVSTDGSDQAAGTADAPFATLTNALASAKEGDVIYVLPGTHSAKASLVLNKPVTLIGISDAAGNRPTIDGANTYRTLKLTHADARAENLRLYRGYVHASSQKNNGGGGLNMSAGKVVNCEFADCYSAGEMPGGSVVMTGGTMSRCSVHGGYTLNGNGNGSGAYVNGSGAVVEHCLFYGNSQNGRQGATSKTAAVYLDAGTVRNCTIVNNNAGKAGGIYVAKGAKFIDSIVWGNVAQNDVTVGAPNWQMASGAIVTNICTPVAMGVTTGGRDLSVFPNFKDLAANDCRLLPGSPCIDAGTLTYPAGALDLAGNPRTDGEATDLGAYELDSREKAVGVSYSITGNMPGDTLTFTAQTTGFGEEEIAAYWNFSDTYPTAEAHDAEGLNGTLTLQAGIYSISLTVVSGGEEYHYQVKSGFTVYGMDMKVVYGNPNARPPYDTWANAAANVADAVALATDGSVITLSNGTYKLTKPIDFLKAFTVQGLTGDPNDVTVDGGNKMLCADIKCAGAVIRDIRLYNGKHDNGGVVSLTANGRVDHCIVDTGYSGGNLHGGCIYMTAGTVSRSIVKNGHTTSGNGNGDGVYMNGADCVLEHSLIINNKSNWSTGKPGAGVYLSNGTVRNCTISGNTGSTAGGIWVGGNGKVLDTIVWGNTTLNDSSVGAPNFVTNCSPDKIVNSWSAVQFGVTVGDFTLFGDPAFVDAANGDYTLGASSGCKDAAWGPATVDFDLAGSNRVQGVAMDLGCYEANPDAFAVDFGFTQAGTVDSATNVFTLIVTPEGTDLSNTQAYWTFDGRIPMAEDHDATGICVTNVFGAGGYDVAMLVVRDGVALDPIVKENLFKVYASLVCLDAANTEGAAKPWDTWANAATNVNEVVPYLTDDSLVLVKPGTYPVKSTIDLLSKITFRGVAGDGVSAPAVAERPVFLKSGNDTIRCFRIGKKGARVEHLSIKGFNYAGVGGDDTGGAVRISAGTLADCTIRDSTAGGNTPGGGVAVSGADALATRCIVTNCATTSSSAGYQGGGVHVSGGGRVENCLIIGCRSNGAGGAYVGQDGTLINCVVTNCSAVVQSGALNTTYPGGVSAGSATAAGGTVANCAIYGNKSGVADVGGQVWGKSENLFLNNALAYPYGRNCVTDDPLFRDAPGGDFHLLSDSPLINAGVNLGYTADSTDIEGNPRIKKTKVKRGQTIDFIDIGCYETKYIGNASILQLR